MAVSANLIRGPQLAAAAAILAALGLFAAVALLMRDGPALPEARPQDGILDLSDWNVADEPVRPLGAGWQFYWNVLLPPAEFEGPEVPPDGIPVDLPAAWQAPDDDGTGRAGRGVATYHLRIELPDRHPPLAIRLPTTYSASILWGNGLPLIVNGQPDRGFARERRVIQDRIAVLPERWSGGPLDLVLQVSNHMVLSGGPTRKPAIGTPDALYQQFGRQVARDLFVVGACVVVGLFFLVLFATRPQERGFAWFAAFNLSVSVIYAHLSDVPLLFAPDLLAATPNAYLILMLVAAPIGAGLFLLVLQALYPGEISLRIVLAACCLLLAYPVVLVFGRVLAPDMLSPYWENVRSVSHAVVLACLAYGTAGVTVAAFRRRRGAIAATAAVLIFAAASLHDLSAVQSGATATPLIGAGLLILVFAYATILGGRLNAAITDAEALSSDLRLLNLTLERKVADRTADLEQAARRAEAADRAKSLFLTAANHDLRQPLHAMALIIGALQGRLQEPGLREMVATLQTCLAGTRRLLAGMLDAARLDAGAIRPERAVCDLAALVDQAVAELEPFAAERGVHLARVNIGHTVLADPAMLARILANLIGNAIKYAPGGRVLVGCRRRGAGLRLEVRDNGIGIAPADHDRIFTEFHQGDPAPRQVREGLGLGLSITRRFARLMGTDVTVRSAPGRGSCFSLDLPLAPAPARASDDDLAGLRVMVVTADAAAIHALLVGWGCIPDGERPDILLAETPATVAEIRRRCGRELPAALIGTDADAGAGLAVLRRPFQPGNLASLVRHLARQNRTLAA